MRAKTTRPLLLLAFTLITSQIAYAVVCDKPAIPDPHETAAENALNAVLVSAALCTAGTEQACSARATKLKTLQTEAKKIQASENDCALNGTLEGGTDLTADQKAYYSTHAAAWQALDTSMTTGASDVTSGKFTIPPAQQASLIAFQNAAPATSIVIPTTLDNSATELQVSGQVPSAFFSTSTLKLCVSNSNPGSSPSSCSVPDCTKQVCFDTDGSQASVPLTTSPTNIKFDVPLDKGLYIWVEQDLKDSAGKSLPATFSKSIHVGEKPYPCVATTTSRPYRDCSLMISIVGGIEQGALASQPSSTNGFLRFFARTPTAWNLFPWTTVRLLSAPQQNSTAGIVAAFTDPSGTITTSTVSSVGQAIDFAAGFEWEFPRQDTHAYSISVVGEGGFTTPLTTDSVTQAFTTPGLTTVECQTLWNSLQQNNQAKAIVNANVILNSPTNDKGTTAGSCLLNKNSPHTDTTVTPNVTKYDPINTLAFENQDRSEFLGKWFFGLRTITRYPPSDASSCATGAASPCHYGFIDFLFGKDASVNGGSLQTWLFKADATHPLPVQKAAFIYLFGSYTAHLGPSKYYPPLILKVADTSALAGTGTSAVPNMSTLVLPLQQPDRDFYRIGVGLDVTCLLTKIFTAGSDCLSSSSTTTKSSDTSNTSPASTPSSTPATKTKQPG